MLDRQEALKLILKGCGDTITAQGFAVSNPGNPIFEDGDSPYFEISKNDLVVRIVSHDNLLDINEGTSEGDFKRHESNLLDLEVFEERDIKSLCNEINDTIITSYGKKSARANKKAPVPVSKSAAKNGVTAYDAYTLANRLTAIYPDLKDAYKENYEKYSEFLGEDFFVNHANKYIIDTIRAYDRVTMKKLFKLLTDIYQNGSNDVQDLVAVTILGELHNDKELLKRCREEITDDDFYETVEAVNQYLASVSGKKAVKKLKNPPKYKPKKDKKGGMMSALANAGQMPPQ